MIQKEIILGNRCSNAITSDLVADQSASAILNALLNVANLSAISVFL